MGCSCSRIRHNNAIHTRRQQIILRQLGQSTVRPQAALFHVHPNTYLLRIVSYRLLSQLRSRHLKGLFSTVYQLRKYNTQCYASPLQSVCALPCRQYDYIYGTAAFGWELCHGRYNKLLFNDVVLTRHRRQRHLI